MPDMSQARHHRETPCKYHFSPPSHTLNPPLLPPSHFPHTNDAEQSTRLIRRQEHHSVTRDGKAGSCGIDNEDDFLVHTSYWMGRVRSKNQNTGLETLVDLMTWGERRKQKHFVDYFTAHPVTLQKEPLPGLIGGEEEEEEDPAEEDQPEEEGQDEGEQPDEGGEENENEEEDEEESEESDDQPRPKIKTTKRPPDDSAAHVPSAKRKRL